MRLAEPFKMVLFEKKPLKEPARFQISSATIFDWFISQ